MIRKCITHAAIILFCLWHAVAIAGFTVPAAATGSVPDFIRRHINPYTAPYLFLTSQWQTWDLFSPDPMRRITRYRIDERTPYTPWETVATLEPATANYWWRTDEFSYFQQLEENVYMGDDLRVRTLRSLCKPLGLKEGTIVAMTVEYAIMPSMPPDQAWIDWWNWRQPWESWLSAIAPCPAENDPSIIPVSPL